MLNDEVVREVDAVAHRLGTNRSALINQILAEYVGCTTPERRIKLKVSVAQLLLSIIAQANRPLHAQGCNKVETVVDEMRIHPERKYSVDEIAVRLNMNATSFLHKFKSATGLPPHAFLAECRIHKAKELLLNAVSVSATAHRCGFTSVKHFATVFRRFTGQPPSKWNSDASLSGESGS